MENNNWKDDAETRYQNEYRQYDYESEMDPRQYVLLEERNIALAVIFSFLTFGIYYIYRIRPAAQNGTAVTDAVTVCRSTSAEREDNYGIFFESRKIHIDGGSVHRGCKFGMGFGSNQMAEG